MENFTDHKGMEESAMENEVFFEIRRHSQGGEEHHGSKSQQIEDGGGARDRGSVLSLLSVGGLYKIKEKWKKYMHPRTSMKRASLFLSTHGEHVAVAFENQITIFQEEDNYKSPCGVFTSHDRSTIFKSGTWLEPAGILSVVDDVDTFYIIKSNGEEMSRTTSAQLKILFPISGMAFALSRQMGLFIVLMSLKSQGHAFTQVQLLNRVQILHRVFVLGFSLGSFVGNYGLWL